MSSVRVNVRMVYRLWRAVESRQIFIHSIFFLAWSSGHLIIVQVEISGPYLFQLYTWDQHARTTHATGLACLCDMIVPHNKDDMVGDQT